MPVGTVGSVKAVTQQQLKDDVKAQIILRKYLSFISTTGTGSYGSSRWIASIYELGQTYSYG